MTNHSDDDVRQELDKIEQEANEHGGDYAAGMRHARLLVEEGLLTE